MYYFLKFFEISILPYCFKSLTYTTLFTKLLDIRPELNPIFIMADFEKEAINALEFKYLSVVTGCFFTCRKTSIGRYSQQALQICTLKTLILLSI